MTLEDYVESFNKAILLSDYEGAREIFETFAKDGRAVSEFARYGELSFGMRELEDEKNATVKKGLAEPSNFLKGCSLVYIPSPDNPLLKIAVVQYEKGQLTSQKAFDYINDFSMATMKRNFDKAKEILRSFLKDEQAVMEFIRFGMMFTVGNLGEAIRDATAKMNDSEE